MPLLGADGLYVGADAASKAYVGAEEVWAAGGGEPVGNVLSLDLPGTTGNYVSTPDSAAVSITSDIDMRIKLSMDNWASVHGWACKYGASGQLSWRLYNAGAGGRPQMDMSGNGTNESGHLVSTGAGFVNGSTNWFRFTWRNSDNRSQFFTSAGAGDPSWVQLGTDSTNINLTGIFDSTAALVLGAGVSAGNGLMLAGNIYYFELRNGIDGPIVAKFNSTAVTKTATRTPTTLASTTGETWTVNGAAWDWVT